MAEEKNSSMICLGHISDAHGIHGEVLIKAYTEAWEDIAAYGPLFSKDGSQQFIIKEINVVKKGVIAKLKNIRYRDEAEALKGQELYVPRDVLPEEEDEDTWYHIDLIGLTAKLEDGTNFGEIISIPNYGAGDLLEIKQAETGKTTLIPFTMACVPEVKIGEGVVIVCPPEEWEGEERV